MSERVQIANHKQQPAAALTALGNIETYWLLLEAAL
jgi:hypothetical protein